MKLVSTLALAASLVVAGASASPADAQRANAAANAQQNAKPKGQKPGVVQMGDRSFTLSAEAQNALAALQKAVAAGDAAAYPGALAAAQAAAKSTDERYLVARMQYDQARRTSNPGGQTQAIQAMIASGGATPTELFSFYSSIGEAAYKANDFAKAEAAFAEMAKLQPNNADVLSNLAIVRGRLGKGGDSVQALNQAMAAKVAAGEAVPEEYHKRAFAAAYNAKDYPLASKANYTWLSAYPTPQNWRDALRNFRALVPMDDNAELDRLRLMRAAGAIPDGRTYTDLAEFLASKNLSAEAKAVLDEGAAKNVLKSSDASYTRLMSQVSGRAASERSTLAGSEAKAASAANGRIASNTADAYFGYSDYGKAAAMYRTALSKGQVDANVINTRLGMSLAMAGDKAGATTAFNAVTGPRAELARYWLLWLNKRG